MAAHRAELLAAADRELWRAACTAALGWPCAVYAHVDEGIVWTVFGPDAAQPPYRSRRIVCLFVATAEAIQARHFSPPPGWADQPGLLAAVRDEIPPSEVPQLEALVEERFCRACFGTSPRRDGVAGTAAGVFARTVLHRRDAYISQATHHALAIYIHRVAAARPVAASPTTAIWCPPDPVALFHDVWHAAARQHAVTVATACEAVYLSACLPAARYQAIVRDACRRLLAVVPAR
ncbi:MAG: hypothetical protein K6V97_15085 [Actinomycetia bacterium]|nr:hypothetical protein [Actinomycetes bacterium]